MDNYDVIIVGTGAGGGTLARHLAPSGKKILLLERGDWLTREPENWSTDAVFVDNRYVSPDTWYDDKGKSFQPGVHYFVGGATKLYGAALYRLRPGDFGELRHHDGISPAWPISYDELEPYYTKAEHLYEVHGNHGEDPTEGPASAQYPHPAVSHEPRIQQLHDDLEAAGYHPFHAPCGILLDEGNRPYSTCVRCATCDGFPCLVHAKSDAEVLGVRPALEHANVTLLTNSKVVRLVTNDGGTAVSEVVVERDGGEERIGGDIVVVACGAANTAKLLLQSANDKHPSGLANGSDQVGRNYMFHDSTAVLALSREENPTSFQKTLGLNDFYFGSDDFEYPLGNVQMVGKSQAGMFRGERPGATRLAPEWTLERVARHAIDLWLSTEDLPRPDNRVTVDRDGKLVLTYSETNAEAKKRLYAKVKSTLGKLDMNPDHLIHRFAYMKNDIPVAGCAHQAGTCRFGTDPAASALDVNCKAHELDNLYVVDTSVFPSIGAVNPALTAMANSLRVGDHLLERLGGLMPDVFPSGEQIEINAGRQRAVVVELGAGLRSYTVAGRNVLDGYEADEMAGAGRGQVLMPWPNRIQDGCYEFAGTWYHLPLTEPEAGNAIHGLVRWVAWTVGEREADRVVMEHTLHPQPGYPFSLALSVGYALSEEGLRVTSTATNVGPDACPYASGAHPYLTVGTETIDPVILRAPGRTVLRTDTRGIPIGSVPVENTEYDFRQPKPIGSTRLDNAYTHLERDADGRARVELENPAGVRLTLWVDESYPYIELFTGDPLPSVRRRSLAVEPMTCPPNAFRTGESVVVLEPGETATGVWGISIEVGGMT